MICEKLLNLEQPMNHKEKGRRRKRKKRSLQVQVQRDMKVTMLVYMKKKREWQLIAFDVKSCARLQMENKQQIIENKAVHTVR